MTIDKRKMRQCLEERRQSLQEQISSQTEAYPTPVDPIGASEGSQDLEEMAADILEMQKEQAIVANARTLLSGVEAALQRLDDGTYGICIVCGKPIAKRRLEAIPWAARCVEDEARQVAT